MMVVLRWKTYNDLAMFSDEYSIIIFLPLPSGVDAEVEDVLVEYDGLNPFVG
jgi:hypothetical protein